MVCDHGLARKVVTGKERTVGLCTVLYTVYGHTTMISIGHRTIHILYHEDHSLKLSVLVQVWYGCRWPFTTIYYSVKQINFVYEYKTVTHLKLS